MEKLAKYIEIRDYIKDKILSGELKVGSQIPTEKQLSEQFKTSRMTVNKAIIRLCENGYIQRVPGKGSFVLNVHISKNKTVECSSFTDDMKSIGLTPGSKLLEYKVIRGADDPFVAEKLELAPDDFIHYFVRLRTGNDSPIAISYTYLSTKILPALDVNILEGSIYSYLDKLGFHRKGMEAEFSATLPTAEQKRLLKIDNEALFKNTHLTFLTDGKPFEYIHTYYIGTKYSYTFKTF
jgi:GntR family transcriptional regulator